MAELRARRSATGPRRRRRSATARASCTRPASSTRAGRRPGCSSRSSTTSPTTSPVPGRGLHVRRSCIAAQAAGDYATLHDARPHGRARPARRGALADGADRLRRPREDGRQHGPSHPPRLRPRVVVFDHHDGRRSRPPRATARPGAGSLEDLVGQARRAADGVDHGPGRRADAVDGRRADRAARRGRHDHRRRQLEVDRRQARARRRCARTASTTSTSARAAASGAWRSATA